MLQHAANTRCMQITQRMQRSQTCVHAGFRYAGEQAAGGLRVEQQRVIRVMQGFFLIAQRPAQAGVGRLQRTEDAGGDGFGCTFQHRQRIQIKFGIDAGGFGHFDQVAEQAEAGEVGAGACAVGDQAGDGGAVGDLHRFQRGVDPAAARFQLRVRGEQGAGADGFGQNQRVAGPQTALGHHAGQRFVDEAVDGEAQREFAAFAGMAADQRAAGFVEHGYRAGHHLEQGVLDLAFKPRRHRAYGGGGLRDGAHREYIAEGMVGGDAAEYPGVVDEGAEEIDRMHQRLARRHAQHGGIVGRVQADQHIVALDWMHLRQRARQHTGADLGAATAAAHGQRGNGLRLFRRREGNPFLRGLAGFFRHGRQFAEAQHEAAVDPVLPAPDPVAAREECAARGDRVLVAGADQGEPAALRAVGFERLIEQRAAQVFGQRRTHANGEYAGLFQRPVDPRCAVTGGEDERVGFGLQGVAHPDEAGRIQRQAGAGQPGGAAGLGDPDDFIGRHALAALGLQAVFSDLHDFGFDMQRDAALGQHVFESAPHGGVVRGQDARTGGEQVHAQLVRVAPLRAQFAAQAVLHGQRQFDAAGSGADHRHRGDAGVIAHPFQQRQPALVELADRLHRHGMRVGTRHMAQLGRRADVDRQRIVGDRRSRAAEHLARVAVDADHFVAVVTRAGKLGQTTHVDMHVVKAVMPGDVARQHAGIWRVGIGADQGQARARQRVHRPHVQDHDMAVAAANQDDVAQYGGFRRLHSINHPQH